MDELSSENDSVKVTPGSVEELLSNVKLLLSAHLVEQTAACFQFDICSGNGQTRRYYLDLSQGKMKEECKKETLSSNFFFIFPISDVVTLVLGIKTFCLKKQKLLM